jgi:fructose-1-phosphate kinase PfkB-like protein
MRLVLLAAVAFATAEASKTNAAISTAIELKQAAEDVRVSFCDTNVILVFFGSFCHGIVA